MKNRALKIVLILETCIIVMVAIYICHIFISSKKTELYRETSPNGEFRLIIHEIGTPDWPFGNDHLRVTLYGTNGNVYIASFKAEVANNGMIRVPKVSVYDPANLYTVCSLTTEYSS